MFVKIDEHDPLSFKAETSNFVGAEDQAGSDEEEDEDVIADKDEDEAPVSKKDGIYRPPKLVPVYNGSLFSLDHFLSVF